MVKAGLAQAAGIAPAAGPPFAIRLIAGHRQAVIHAELDAAPDNLRLGPVDERRMDMEGAAFHRGAGGEIGHFLEGREILRPAVRVARVIHRIDADENLLAAQHLGPGQCQGEHDGVARRDIGGRNAFAWGDGHGNGAVGQRRTAERGEVEPHRAIAMRSVPDWSIQVAWWVSGIFATGAVWYFLSTKDIALAVSSALIAVLFAGVAILLHRKKDALAVSLVPNELKSELPDGYIRRRTDSDAHVRLVRHLPELKAVVHHSSSEGWESPVTLDMREASYDMIEFLQFAWLRLAEFYPRKH